MVQSVVEAFVPRRLGTSFRWLVASSWVSNLGDGIAVAAGPLLVASQTHDPFLVALAPLLGGLPWLLFGLVAGALTDRLDRRRLILAVEGLRLLVVVLLCLSIATDTVSVALVLAVLFVSATCEVFADSASGTLAPMLVQPRDLGLANARMMAGFISVNQLFGPPLGALLFAAGMVLPFVAQAVLLAAAFACFRNVRLPAHGEAKETHLREEIVEGFRWVVHHPAVRTLVVTIFVFNITWGAAWSVLVLYARDRLGLQSVGFGLLTTISALGGLAGTALYGRITQRFSLGAIMRVGLLFETVTHLGLAITTQPLVAYVIFFLFGAHAFIWSTTSMTVRQRAVPRDLQGRVNSVNSASTFGSVVLGSALGGLIAQRWGVTAPFWFAFVGSAVFVALMWRQLAHIAHDDEDVEQAVEGADVRRPAGPVPAASP